MGFKFETFDIEGLILVKPDVFRDDRGFFKETYKQSLFESGGIKGVFVQDNFSFSSRGVLRGLHYQLGNHAQGKLVSVARGRVWDVAVDIRKSSSTFGNWIGVELSEDNHHQFWIPPGFAHGFVVLEDNTVFQYKCTKEYHKGSEGAIRWNDASLNIQWPLKDVTVSEKDAAAPLFGQGEVFP